MLDFARHPSPQHLACSSTQGCLSVLEIASMNKMEHGEHLALIFTCHHVHFSGATPFSQYVSAVMDFPPPYTVIQ
jgi:hypothetical protein